MKNPFTVITLLMAVIITGCETTDTSKAPQSQPPDTAINTYSIRYGEMSWHEAKAKAEEAGGFLACIETQEEMDHIQSMRENRKTLWVGLTDEDSEGEWYWINGVPLDLEMKGWIERGGDLHNRDYAHIMRQGGFLSRPNSGEMSGGWKGSSKVEGYVIEWD